MRQKRFTFWRLPPVVLCYGHQRAEGSGESRLLLLFTTTTNSCSHLPTTTSISVYLLCVKEKMRFFQCGNRRHCCCLSASGRKKKLHLLFTAGQDFSVSKGATTTTCQIQPGVGREFEAHGQRCGIPPPRVHEADPSFSSSRLS